jgi:hypothetical protein
MLSTNYKASWSPVESAEISFGQIVREKNLGFTLACGVLLADYYESSINESTTSAVLG